MASRLALTTQPWAAGSRVRLPYSRVQEAACKPSRRYGPESLCDHESRRTVPSLQASSGARRRPARVAAVAAPEGGATGAKLRASATELLAEVERLRAENEALRAALADLQSSESAAEVLEAAANAAVAPTKAAPAEPVKSLAEQLEEGIRWPSPEEGNFWERPPRTAPLPLAPPAGSGTKAVPQDPCAFHVVHITGE